MCVLREFLPKWLATCLEASSLAPLDHAGAQRKILGIKRSKYKVKGISFRYCLASQLITTRFQFKKSLSLATTGSLHYGRQFTFQRQRTKVSGSNRPRNDRAGGKDTYNIANASPLYQPGGFANPRSHP